VASSLHDPHMVALELMGTAEATGVGQHVELLVDLGGVAGDPFRLFRHHQPFLQPWVLGGDAGGTAILMTLQRLDAAQ